MLPESLGPNPKPFEVNESFINWLDLHGGTLTKPCTLETSGLPNLEQTTPDHIGTLPVPQQKIVEPNLLLQGI